MAILGGEGAIAPISEAEPHALTVVDGNRGEQCAVVARARDKGRDWQHQAINANELISLGCLTNRDQSQSVVRVLYVDARVFTRGADVAAECLRRVAGPISAIVDWRLVRVSEVQRADVGCVDVAFHALQKIAVGSEAEGDDVIGGQLVEGKAWLCRPLLLGSHVGPECACRLDHRVGVARTLSL